MTYERILKEIKKPNRRLAQRVLQCLVVHQEDDTLLGVPVDACGSHDAM